MSQDNSYFCQTNSDVDNVSKKDPTLCPLQFLRDAYVVQLELCDALEEIADALPQRPCNGAVQRIISKLDGDLARQIAAAEQQLFATLEQPNNKSDLNRIIQKLKIERSSDEDLAGELLASFEAILQYQKIQDSESFGYMLRGYFESKRRQLGWMTDVVLPMILDSPENDQLRQSSN